MTRPESGTRRTSDTNTLLTGELARALEEGRLQRASPSLLRHHRRIRSTSRFAKAIGQMLNAQASRSPSRRREWSTLCVQRARGGVSYYLHEVGLDHRSSVMMQQYFGTGGSPRIGLFQPRAESSWSRSARPSTTNARMRCCSRRWDDPTKRHGVFLWRHQWPGACPSRSIRARGNGGGIHLRQQDSPQIQVRTRSGIRRQC